MFQLNKDLVKATRSNVLGRKWKILFTTFFLSLAACEEVPTYSILTETDDYQQKSAFSNKLDILFVIDNSGSMQNLQNNVAANFNSFINQFASKGYDFQIAVTTTDAWLVDKGNQYCSQNSNAAKFKNDSGHSILTKDTPNLEQAFIDNVLQGTSGCGDERAFDSVVKALEDADNQALGFPRKDSFFAVIIISDEDDFSHNDGDYLGNDYNYAGLHSVQSYVDALDAYTASTGASRAYNVSAISINDSTCLAANDPWGLIAHRYNELVELTNGVAGDVCAADFTQNLISIQDKIVTLSTQFYLSRQPIESTIQVLVDGQEILNDSANGWTYNSESNSILFHGNAVPSQGSNINIVFDPIELKN